MVEKKAVKSEGTWKPHPVGKESIAPERIRLGDKYTFTLNLPETELLGMFPEQYDKYCRKIKSIINNDMAVMGALEYSQYGRLHFHGELIFKNELSVALFYMRLGKIKCNYSFDSSDKEYDISKYAFKGEWYMKPLHDKYSKQYKICNELLNTPECFRTVLPSMGPGKIDFE